MILEKIYNEAYLNKKEEIFRRYNEEKKIVAKGKLPVFQKKFQEKINIDYAELFSQNTDEKCEYHFIEEFNNKMPGIEDSYLTFDEDFQNTKANVKAIYMNHDYKPKVDIFFKQSDETIVKKLGHYKAYNELRTGLVQALFETEKKKSAPGIEEEIDHMNKSDQSVGQTGTIVEPLKNEKNFTSIKQIADYFNCSIPTAQKIKNSIPKDQYSQKERTFAIPESVLLKNYRGNT